MDDGGIMWSYYTLREACRREGIGTYLSYGIRVIGSIPGQKVRILRDLNDIFPDREVVDALITLSTKLELEPVQLVSLIESWK